MKFIIFYIILLLILTVLTFYLTISSFLNDWKLAKDVIIFEKFIKYGEKSNILNERILNRLEFETDNVKKNILNDIVNSRYSLSILDEKHFMGAIVNWIHFINSDNLNPKKIKLNNDLLEHKLDYLIDNYLKENYGFYI